jgi:hypothetical protein
VRSTPSLSRYSRLQKPERFAAVDHRLAFEDAIESKTACG